MPELIDLTGQKFGRWTVIERTKNNKWNRPMWLCQCDCKGENSLKIVSGANLKKGNSKSCGCLQREIVRESTRKTGKANKKYNKYNLTGDYGIGYISNNEEFYFDLEDYDLIKDYYWNIHPDGYIITGSYKEKTIILMHRLITNCPDDMEVDHEFHNLYDNRKEFLRIVTKSQNSMNTGLRADNTSGVTGVCWSNKSNKWQAYIQKEGNRIYLGAYDDFDEAVEVRKQAEEQYFGEYAYKSLNK